MQTRLLRTHTQVASELFLQMDRGAKGHVTKEDYVHLAQTQPELIKQAPLHDRYMTVT